MRVFAIVTLSLCLGLSTSACQSQSQSPVVPAPASSATLPAYEFQSHGDSLVAQFHIAIDPATMSATVEPVRGATAQPPQAQRYDLDIANFQNANSLRITGVQVLGSGNIRLTYSHAHPFPAPDPTLPATAANRADLGYTGRLVMLTQFNPRAFFSGAAILSAGGVVSPDGYVEVGDLLAQSSLSLVTAYPYKLLADEALDNRTGASNGGLPEGSFAAPLGGWQFGNLGVNRIGWTGFDYVHGGQTITNTFTLSKALLESSNFALDVALLIQYTDPRGQGGKVNRLPPTGTINALEFGYRLPYAALDCSRVIPTANLQLEDALDSSVAIQVRVRDWDALATEAPGTALGALSDVALIQAGGSGVPEVVLDAPGILSGLRNMGAPTGTGRSDNPLLYTNQLVNQLAAPKGDYFGCIRVIDPEDADAMRGTYHAGVDATTLAPDAARAVPARTWQIVPITVGSDVPVITRVLPYGIAGATGTMTTFTADISGEVDSFLWDFGTGASPQDSTDAEPVVKLGFPARTYTGILIATNAAGDSDPFVFTYQILPPAKPGVHAGLVAGETATLSSQPDHNAILVYNGKPVVAYPYSTLAPPSSGMVIMLANVPLPQGPDDWTLGIHWDANVHGIGISLAEVNGLIAFASGISSRLIYGYADDPNPQQPDWHAAVIRGTGVGPLWGLQQALVDSHGRPTMIAIRHDTGEAVYLQGGSVASLLAGEWGSYTLDGDAGQCALTTVQDGATRRLAAVLSDGTNDNIRVMIATTPNDPDTLLDWSLRTYPVIDPRSLDIVPANFGTGAPGLAIAVGRIALPPMFFALEVGSSAVPQLRDAYELDIAGVGNPFPSLTSLNGRLALAINQGGPSGRVTLARAMQPFPGERDWDYLSLTGPVRTQPHLDTIDNRFICFAIDVRSPWIPECYITDGPW